MLWFLSTNFLTLMYISEEQFKDRMSGQCKSTVTVVTPATKIHKHKGDDKLSLDERAMIGVLANEIGCSEASKLMDVSPSTASNYSKGITTRANGLNALLKDKVEEKSKVVENKVEKTVTEKLTAAKEQAIDNMVSLLGKLGNMGVSKATDASKIAVDMSKIHRNLEGGGDKNGNNGNGKVQVLIHRPTMNDERDYTVVKVG